MLSYAVVDCLLVHENERFVMCVHCIACDDRLLYCHLAPTACSIDSETLLHLTSLLYLSHYALLYFHRLHYT